MNFELLKNIFSFQEKPSSAYPDFYVGDTISVSFLINDQKKQRLQIFSGVVIGKKGTLNTRSFRVRRMQNEYSVEKVFFYNSPLIRKISVLRRGKVRRSKIYYIRNLRGKAARVKEKKVFLTK